MAGGCVLGATFIYQHCLTGKWQSTLQCTRALPAPPFDWLKGWNGSSRAAGGDSSCQALPPHKRRTILGSGGGHLLCFQVRLVGARTPDGEPPAGVRGEGGGGTARKAGWSGRLLVEGEVCGACVLGGVAFELVPRSGSGSYGRHSLQQPKSSRSALFNMMLLCCSSREIESKT